jgi:hypothetical protein
MFPEKEGHGGGGEGEEGGRKRRASKHTGRKDVIAGQEWKGVSRKEGGREGRGLVLPGEENTQLYTYVSSIG